MATQQDLINTSADMRVLTQTTQDPHYLNNCNNRIDINSTQMDKKNFNIELNLIVLSYFTKEGMINFKAKNVFCLF